MEVRDYCEWMHARARKQFLEATLMFTRAKQQARIAIRMRACTEKQAQEAILMQEEIAEMRVRLRLGWVADIDPEKDCEAILNCTLDTALSISHAEMGNIQLLDGGRRDLEIRAQRGFKAPFLDFFGSLNTERTACSFALREARPITVEDITNSPIFKGTQGMEVLLEAEVRAVLSTPLIGSTGQVLGVLSVHYRQPRLYWNDETVRLSILARTAARLIEGGMGKSS